MIIMEKLSPSSLSNASQKMPLRVRVREQIVRVRRVLAGLFVNQGDTKWDIGLKFASVVLVGASSYQAINLLFLTPPWQGDDPRFHTKKSATPATQMLPPLDLGHIATSLQPTNSSTEALIENNDNGQK